MIQKYTERAVRETYGAQWFPDQELPKSDNFNPNITERDGRYFLQHEWGGEERIQPGWFITYSGPVIGYEAWIPEVFHEEFIAIHENSKTVV